MLWVKLFFSNKNKRKLFIWCVILVLLLVVASTIYNNFFVFPPKYKLIKPNASFPSWSCDSSQIIFTSHRKNYNEIYIINTDESSLELLTHFHYFPFFYNWELEQNIIIAMYNTSTGCVIGEDEITYFSLTEKIPFCWSGEKGTWVPAKPQDDAIYSCDPVTNVPVISPSKQNIVYVNPSKDGFIVSYFNGGNRTNISLNAPSKYLWSPKFKWSPDERYIALKSNASDNHRLYIYDRIENKKILVPGHANYYEWAPSKNQLAVNTSANGSAKLEIINLSNNTSIEINGIEGEYYYFDWSPDGWKIGFISSVGKREIFYVYDIKNDILSKILELEEDKEAFSYSWKPDSSGIAYSYYNYEEHRGYLYYLDFQEDNPVQLIGEGRDYISYQWSPNGDKIFYTSDQGNKEYLIVFDFSKKQELIRVPGNWLSFISWSPDGNKIAYISKWSIFNLDMLFVLDVESGETQCQTCNSFWSNWHIIKSW